MSTYENHAFPTYKQVFVKCRTNVCSDTSDHPHTRVSRASYKWSDKLEMKNDVRVMNNSDKWREVMIKCQSKSKWFIFVWSTEIFLFICTRGIMLFCSVYILFILLFVCLWFISIWTLYTKTLIDWWLMNTVFYIQATGFIWVVCCY